MNQSLSKRERPTGSNKTILGCRCEWHMGGRPTRQVEVQIWTCISSRHWTGYRGHLLWLKVWWTNSNPRLILSYYLEAVSEAWGVSQLLRQFLLKLTGNALVIPMITQSDPGTENYGIANRHTFLCQWHDQISQGPCNIAGCVKRRTWYPK